jgi:diacylglycerol kinase (ATP)
MRRIHSATLNSARGLRWAFRNEAAFRQESIGLMLAVPVALAVAEDAATFAALIGVIFALLAVELLNTAVEKLADHITPEHHPQIGLVKDIGSAAVLAMLCLCALVWSVALWRWWSA